MLRLFILLLLLSPVYQILAQIGIGTTTPESSALLELSSSEKGFLIPRMSRVERDLISSPAEGLLIYNTDYNCVDLYNGTVWQGIGGCDYTVALTFTGSPAYNGPSPIDALGIGYYDEPISESSTISVDFTATDIVPYTFTATDATTGLTYTVTGTSTSGSNTAVLVPNTPTITTPGTINMTLTGASNTMALAPRIDIKSLTMAETEIVEVPIDIDNADGDNDNSTGADQIWMDRNLGARQKATAQNDAFAYGSIYQWGRFGDGHEIMVTSGDDSGISAGLNGTTPTNATSDTPGHNMYILESALPVDWRTPQNDNLWQGAAGINNPCPSGYRIPTQTELDDLITAENITNVATAHTSDLAFSAPGFRNRTNGVMALVGSIGTYWSSTVSGTDVVYMILDSGSGTNFNRRAAGFQVRCIKD